MKQYQLDVSPSQLNGPVEIKLTGSDASEEEAVSLAQSLNALSKIHRGITKIQMQQQRDRHRLALHSEKNVDNYNNVMFGSIIETAIFVAVSVFQVKYSSDDLVMITN